MQHSAPLSSPCSRGKPLLLACLSCVTDRLEQHFFKGQNKIFRSPVNLRRLTASRSYTEQATQQATQQVFEATGEDLLASFSRTESNKGQRGLDFPQLDLGSTIAQPLRKPEVLAPAGGWPQLRAAVENGADAVYFGLSSFNARARAANFTPEELEEVLVPALLCGLDS